MLWPDQRPKWAALSLDQIIIGFTCTISSCCEASFCLGASEQRHRVSLLCVVEEQVVEPARCYCLLPSQGNVRMSLTAKILLPLEKRCLRCLSAIRRDAGIGPRVVPRSKTKKKLQLQSPPTVEEKVTIGETDMPQALQSHAVRAVSEALDMYEVTDFKEVAYYINNQFDKAYGSGWQCVTGVTFGSYVTHSSGSFIHFSWEG